MIYAYTPHNINRNFKAFIDALNSTITAIIDTIKTINACYLLDKTGDALDFYAAGVYGIYRPTIALGAIGEHGGGFGQRSFLTRFLSYDSGSGLAPTKTLNDDEFKRLIVWYLYSDDTKQFSIAWLKSRIARFLGVERKEININLLNSTIRIVLKKDNPYSLIFKWLLISDYLNLPYSYKYIVILK